MKHALIPQAALCLSISLLSSAQAVTFTYSGVTGSNDWSSGTDWDAVPVSASDTIITYTGVLGDGAVVGSNNDVADPFTLNRLDLDYQGAAAGEATPEITISGGALNFVNDGGTGPQLVLTPVDPDGSRDPLGNVKPNLTLNNNFSVTDNLVINTNIDTVYNGIISGSGSMRFTGSAGQSALNVFANASSTWTGDLTIQTNGTTGSTRTVRLGADSLLHGNVTLSSDGEGTHVAKLQTFGTNQTIQGLNAVYEDNMRSKDGNHVIENGADTNSVLTIGVNDTSASYLGQINDGGGTGTLSVIKTGSGTQTLAARSNYTGTTTVEGGTLEVDFTQIGLSKTSDPSNYFTTSSDLTLKGGTTFAIKGLENGEAVTDSVGTQLYGNYITVSSQEISDQLVVGQELTLTLDATEKTYYVTGKNGTDIYTESRTGGGVRTLTTSATDSSTTQDLQSLTLAGLDGKNATIDFGNSDNVTITVNASPVQLNDGSTITFANWSGSILGGGDDQLLFLGTSTDFSSVLSQSEVFFDGYGAGYALIEGSGFYEVVAAVPEPSTYALIMASGALLVVMRRRKQNA